MLEGGVKNPAGSGPRAHQVGGGVSICGKEEGEPFLTPSNESLKGRKGIRTGRATKGIKGIRLDCMVKKRARQSWKTSFTPFTTDGRRMRGMP